MCLFIGKYNLIYSKTDFCRGIRNYFYSKSKGSYDCLVGQNVVFLIDRYLPLKGLGALTGLRALLHIYIHLSGNEPGPRK